MPGELRAVLFDLDGTLVDTEHLWWQAYAEVTARLGGTATDADGEHVYGMAIDHAADHLLRRLRGLPAGAEQPGGAGERARVTEMLTHAFATRIAAHGASVQPGAVELLDALAAERVATALVTASPRWITDRMLRVLGPHRFRVTVTADDTPRGKPAPEPYLLAMAELGVRPEECVAVEDSAIGAASARAAGCAVLLVARGGLAGVDPARLRGLIGGRRDGR